MPGTKRTARATCEKRAPFSCAPPQRSSAARESGSARASAASKMRPPSVATACVPAPSELISCKFTGKGGEWAVAVDRLHVPASRRVVDDVAHVAEGVVALPKQRSPARPRSEADAARRRHIPTTVGGKTSRSCWAALGGPSTRRPTRSSTRWSSSWRRRARRTRRRRANLTARGPRTPRSLILRRELPLPPQGRSTGQVGGQQTPRRRRCRPVARRGGCGAWAR